MEGEPQMQAKLRKRPHTPSPAKVEFIVQEYVAQLVVLGLAPNCEPLLADPPPEPIEGEIRIVEYIQDVAIEELLIQEDNGSAT